MDDIKINPLGPVSDDQGNANAPETFALGANPVGANAAENSVPVEETKIVLDTPALEPLQETPPAIPADNAALAEDTKIVLDTPAPQPSAETPPANLLEPTSEIMPAVGQATEQPAAQEQLSVAPNAAETTTGELTQQEPLPPPSDSLIEAATGIPQPEPEETAGMSKKKKIGLIVAGVLVVISAIGALMFFSGGSPFKGQVAPSDNIYFAPAVLCPTDYYAPKTSAFLKRDNFDLSVAKAQLLPFTEDGIMAVDTARDTVDMIESSRADGLSALDVVGEELRDNDPATGEQPGILSESATLDQEQPAPVDSDTGMMINDGMMDVAVVIPEGCFPIPHDNLTQGNDQCGLVDQLFLDPAGYRLNEETKTHVDDWHLVCNPPVAVDTTVLCGENQMPSSAPVGAAPTCVCMEGYFDVSYILPDVAIAIDSPVGAAPSDAITKTLVCWNCDMLQAEIEKNKSLLEAASTVDEQTILEERIKTLETVSLRNGCVKTVETQELCGENEIRNSAGECVCANHYTKAAVADICIYDCDFVVQKILDLRKSATTEADTNLLNDLVDHEKEAALNGCAVPDVQTECERYAEESNDAFNDRDYDLYYENSSKYIDANCSGSTVNDCQKILAKGVSVNRIMDSIIAPAVPAKWEDELLRLQAEYYANPACNNTVDRCAALDARFGGTSVPATPSNVMIDQPVSDRIESGDLDLYITDTVTPGNVFEDDREYYNTYCTEEEFTCEEILANMTLDQIVLLDLTADQRDRYEACFVTETRPTPTNAPTPVIELPAPIPTPTPTAAPTPTIELPPTPPPTPTPVVTSPPAPVAPPAAPAVVSTASDDETVETESAVISLAEFSSPVPPSETVVEERNEVMEPEEPIHSASPEDPTVPAPTPVYEEVPPAITPTGPETYIYLAGLLLGQLVFFRKRIFARMISR